VHTLEVKQELASVLAVMLDAKSGARGFLLTRSPEALTVFQDANGQRQAHSDRLRASTGHMTDPNELRSLAHDFKNQLGIVLGFSELLLAEFAPDNPHRPDIEEIEKAARAAVLLVDRLRAMIPVEDE
jgi:signal transduction histidine kinase